MWRKLYIWKQYGRQISNISDIHDVTKLNVPLVSFIWQYSCVWLSCNNPTILFLFSFRLWVFWEICLWFGERPFHNMHLEIFFLVYLLNVSISNFNICWIDNYRECYSVDCELRFFSHYIFFLSSFGIKHNGL